MREESRRIRNTEYGTGRTEGEERWREYTPIHKRGNAAIQLPDCFAVDGGPFLFAIDGSQ